MKNEVINILDKYLSIYPDEVERQEKLKEFIDRNTDESITDWNNFDGHIVASGFVYAKKEKKFLMLFHNDFKIYLYPGGHVDPGEGILDAAKREIREETSITDTEQIKIDENEMVPIDISTHQIGYHETLNLPEHYHFDFRYLFTIDKIEDVTIDINESSDYKWIDADELKNQSFGMVIDKVLNILDDKKI